jgi:signal-transduction protein with cAMP-binding, CBS, and nucleotidyltransferase domain
MKDHGVGAVVVVANTSDPLLEGIVTDRDLCCGVVACGKSPYAVKVVDLMTPIPVTCGPEEILDECVRLMRENQVRRIPVINERARCVGIVALADVALHARRDQAAQALDKISNPARPKEQIPFEKDFFYCGQTHEMDQILLLKRRRGLAQNLRCSRDLCESI